MNGPLAAARDFLVAPASPRARQAAHAALTCPSVAVLGSPEDAFAVACGLALARGGCGLVCEWPPGESRPGLPAAPGARRLAARLATRGLEATASGRLVRLRLPASPAEALATAPRATAAAGVPAAIALSAPRGEDVDSLLALQDAVVLALDVEAARPLALLAVAGLAELAVPVTVARPPGGLARVLAVAGVAAMPPLRHALAPALALEPVA